MSRTKATTPAPNQGLSAEGNAPLPSPSLKPITGKPFPEGVSEAVVCEAVNSKESDLWLRFGHLIPLYMDGAIFVLKAGKHKESEIADFVQNKYVHPHFPQQKSCGDKTLLYVSRLMEQSQLGGKPFGRLHLSAELDRVVGTETLESFGVNSDGQARLAAYCRVDADACERLVNLNGSTHGEGLCGSAVHFADVMDTDPGYNSALQRCKRLRPEQKACAYYGYGTGAERTREQADEQARCEASLRALLAN